MSDKREILNDMKFCKELMDRLYRFTTENYGDPYSPKNTVVQNDIIRLRRELMNVAKKL